MKYLALLLCLLCLAGCGGGQPATTASSPVPAPPPSGTPPPVLLPRTYVLTILPPVDGGTAARAEAINASGMVVGYSVVDGAAEATEWRNGVPIDLGPGIAVAISGNLIAGYCATCGAIDFRTGVVTTNPIAQIWPGGPIGTLAGYDSSEALGVDEDGTVVGVAFVLADPSHQRAWKWRAGEGGMLPVPGLLEALAIRNGQIAGFNDSFEAAIGGAAVTVPRDLGIQGASTAISSKGAAGFSFGQTQAFSWQDDALRLLGTAGTDISLASGINDSGIVVGQIGNAISGSVRLARRPVSSPHARFVGVTRAMAWTAPDGIVDLNGRITGGSGWTLAYATGINGSGEIVGAAISDEQVTEGFVLQPQP